MYLNKDQTLGWQCSDATLSYYYSHISGCGEFNNSYGDFFVNGVALVTAQFNGVGFFASTPGCTFSGYASGFIGSNPLDFYGNGLPYVTYSGYGSISGSDIVSWFPIPGYFKGRNFFWIPDYSSMVSGQTVLCQFYGNGTAWLSGSFFVHGSIEGMTGCAIGTGTLNGSGVVVIVNQPVQANICSGYFNRFLASGDFAATGIVSGSGTYSITAAPVFGYSGYESFYLPYPQHVWGSGDYFTVDGSNFSGFSAGPFWGSGYAWGPHIVYPYGGNLDTSCVFWGSGAFTGQFGWLRGTSGWYGSDGSAKGVGVFNFVGYGSGLLHEDIIMSGSGIAVGAGTIFLTNPSGAITGINCIPPVLSTPVNNTTCGNFPPFITNCSQLGNLPIDFVYNGNCVVEGGAF